MKKRNISNIFKKASGNKNLEKSLSLNIKLSSIEQEMDKLSYEYTKHLPVCGPMDEKFHRTYNSLFNDPRYKSLQEQKNNALNKLSKLREKDIPLDHKYFPKGGIIGASIA